LDICPGTWTRKSGCSSPLDQRMPVFVDFVAIHSLSVLRCF
jgi:hypothetical protein